ncbi:MAG: orotidine 5'-phosphate decarboxylase, partial [Candidatus Bathyarchaeota archaeon]|nr:orotidine 5'-phosphate decarboxylase [Candidatus Bathyarchaeota archaeon]
PEKIREIRAVLRDKVSIYSPGVGAQGGDVEAAVKAGASYLIVGRAIVDAKDPIKTAEKIRDTAWQSVKRRSGKIG